MHGQQNINQLMSFKGRAAACCDSHTNTEHINALCMWQSCRDSPKVHQAVHTVTVFRKLVGKELRI